MNNRLIHPSERSLDLSAWGATSCRSHIEALTRCYCISSSQSSSKQEQSSVSGASAVGQGAATAGDFSRVQTGGVHTEGSGVTIADSSVNISGVQGDAVAQLVGGLTKASNEQIKEAIAAGTENVSALTSLLAAEKDSQAGNPKTLAYVALAGMAGLALVFVWSKK